jgi:hypothetical protein
MSKNILGQPNYKPTGYTISEYDISSGILRPATIPIQVQQKLPIQREPRVQLPQVNLSTLDTRMDLLREKIKTDPQYNTMPQLIKLPKDTRISASDLLKKGKTLYDLYNKTQKKARQQREEPQEELPEQQPLPDDEGKHDTDKPPAPSRPAPTRPEVFDPTIQTTEQPSISVIQDEVKMPDGQTIQRVPGRDVPEAETFDPEPKGEKPTIADVVNAPNPNVFEPYNWRPIQGIDQFNIPFFIPSVVGEDPLQPSMRAPEQQRIDDDDEPVNLWM